MAAFVVHSFHLEYHIFIFLSVITSVHISIHPKNWFLFSNFSLPRPNAIMKLKHNAYTTKHNLGDVTFKVFELCPFINETFTHHITFLSLSLFITG